MIEAPRVLSSSVMLAVVLALAAVPASSRLMPVGRDPQSRGRHVAEAPASLSASFCSSPIAKGAVEFPETLIGRASHDFGMWSGYVNVTSEDWLFYWLAESKDSSPDAPLVFWTNGGPGCSSMEGATTEIGPVVLFQIKESCSSSKCDYTDQLSTNPYAWNNHANLVFVDQPRNVGYSFGYGKGIHSSVDAGLDFVTFISGFLELFPEFKDRKVYVAGESYGGHYLPAFANAILDYNEDASEPIKFSGLAIGNGCVNDTVQNTEQYVEFLHASNLIPSTSNPKTEEAAYLHMVSYIGYIPNYYDYRVKSITCVACYGYNYSAWSNWHLREDVTTALNVCGDAGVDAFAGAAGGCISVSPFDVNDGFDYSAALARVLELDLPVVFYYGMTDTACNYVGGYDMANTIPWSRASEFSIMELTDLEIAGAKAGAMKQLGPLTWIQAESSGHMTPIDQPSAASYAISQLLSYEG